MDSFSAFLGYLEYFKESPLALRILYALITIIVFVIAERLIRRYLGRLVQKNIIAQSVASRVASIIDIILYLLLVVTVLFEITMVKELIWLIVGVILILMASLWPLLENIQSYFALLTSRSVNPGKIITVDGTTGKVLEMNPIYTIVRTTGGDLVYIPNRKLLTEQHTIEHEYELHTLHLIVKNLNDPNEIDLVEDRIKNVLATKFRLGVKGIEPRIQLVRVSRNHAEYRISYAVIGTEVKFTHVSHLVKLLLDELREFDVEIRVK